MRNKRSKVMVWLIISIMLVSNFSMTFALGQDYQSHWAKDAIQFYVDDGTIGGYPDGTFRPENPIKRAEFATLLDNLFKLTETSELDYDDVDEGEWYYDAVNRIITAEIMVGSNGLFRPEEYITREEAATTLARAYKLSGTTLKASYFSDASEISVWAFKPVSALFDLGYISGIGGNRFNPKGFLKRGEMVTMLYNLNPIYITLFEEEIVEEEVALAAPDVATRRNSGGSSNTTPTVEQVIAPTISTSGGEVEQDIAVFLETATSGASIYYTTDGSEPNSGDEKYTDCILIDSDMTLKAVAIKTGMENSEVLTASFTVGERAEYAGGSGTEEDPYLIATSHQFYNVRNNLDANFLQIRDFNFWMWQGFEPITGEFTGTYDGNGKTMSDCILMVWEDTDVIGLFGTLNGSTIKNLNLEGFGIGGTESTKALGILAGSIKSGSVVENCLVVGSIMGNQGYTGGLAGEILGSEVINTHVKIVGAGLEKFGGFAGYVEDSRISKSSVYGRYIESSYINIFNDKSAGFILYAEDSQIDECYAMLDIEEYSDEAAGFVGTANDTIISNCFTKAKFHEFDEAAAFAISATGEIINSYAAIDYGNRSLPFVETPGGMVSGCYTDVDLSGDILEVIATPKTTDEMSLQETFGEFDFDSVWTIDEGATYPYFKWESNHFPVTHGTFSAGTGIVGDPYVITNAVQLSSIRHALDKKYIITESIPLTGYNWEPIGDVYKPFTGTLIGDDEKPEISNVMIDQTGDNVGLFGYAERAQYANFEIDDAKVYGRRCVGVLVGNATQLEIRNVEIDGSVYGENQVGGLSGRIEAPTEDPKTIIEDIEIDVEIGQNNGRLYSAGSLVGTLTRADVNMIKARTTIKGDKSSNYIGGLIGKTNKDNSFENINIALMSEPDEYGLTADHYVGGAIGFSGDGDHLKNVHVGGNIKGVATVGGLIGYASSFLGNRMIENCHYSGNLYFEDVGGGLCGITEYTTIKESSAEGTIDGKYLIGGLVGRLSLSEIQSSKSTMNIVSTDENSVVGGLIGLGINNSKISDSYNLGNIEAPSKKMGGIAGEANKLTLERTYNAGDVTSTSDDIIAVGGLSGNIAAELSLVSNVVFPCEISSAEETTEKINRISGSKNIFLVMNNFGHKEALVNGQQREGEEWEGETFEDPMLIYYRLEWDFDNVWGLNETVNDGLPFLRWEGHENTITIVDPRVATPKVSHTDTSFPMGYTVELTCDTEGATIYYTTNGSLPTLFGTEYTEPITISSDMTLKAYAVKDDLDDSEIFEITYTVFDPSIFTEGDGSEGNPYQIEYFEQLDNIRNYLDKHFIIMNDIVLTNDQKAAFQIPIGSEVEGFTGSIKGVEGDTQVKISNVGIVNSDYDKNIGIFGYAYGASFKNFILDNNSVTGYENVGLLLGKGQNVMFEDINVFNGTLFAEKKVGTLIGYSLGDGTMKNITVDSRITFGKQNGGNGAGGLVGYAEALDIDD